MDQARTNDIELSLLKTANITGFLLNLDTICSTITTARSCIAGCGIDSESNNPFALESMTSICSQESFTEVEMVGQCLLDQSNEVMEQCKTNCGDYDKINDEVHESSKSFRPNSNEPEKLANVMSKINAGCGTLKCNNRCVVKMLTEQCGPMENGGNVGSVVKALVEKVLVAQRRDLERMSLVDTMAHSIPVQCNYMYMPEVMFNATQDEQAMELIDETLKNEQLQKGAQLRPSTNEADKKKELNLALSQFQAQLLQKQIRLLDIQEKNLIRESHKLDLELQILARKRQQNNIDDGMIKQQF